MWVLDFTNGTISLQMGQSLLRAYLVVAFRRPYPDGTVKENNESCLTFSQLSAKKCVFDPKGGIAKHALNHVLLDVFPKSFFKNAGKVGGILKANSNSDFRNRKDFFSL